MSGLFGGGKKTKKEESTSTSVIQRAAPISIDATTAGGGSVNVGYEDGSLNPTATASIDSRVRKQIGEGLNNSRRALGRLEKTIAGLRSNTNDFIKARVRPLEEALDLRIAQKGREFASRNIYGGLASTEIDNLRVAGERELSDQRALATREALSAVLSAEGVAAGVNDKIFQAADRYLQADIAEMGLNLDAIRLSQAARLPTGETTESNSKTTTRGGGNILGTVLGAAAMFYNPAAGAAAIAGSSGGGFTNPSALGLN